MAGVSAAKLVEVTLVRAWSPAAPDGHAAHRITFGMALDAHGGPDAEAWLADPGPWPARREQEGGASLAGDVAHDEEGWSLRFWPEGTPAPEAPLHRILGGPGWLRPGEVVTIREPNGAEAAWRVVAVG
jgi:hypothetical protein